MLNGVGPQKHLDMQESRPVTKIKQTGTKPKIHIKKLSSKLFLKSTEVQELYGISAQTLANWSSKKVGPKYHKVGGAVRYKVEDLDKFMESKRIKTG